MSPNILSSTRKCSWSYYLCYASTMREEILDNISIYGFADDHELKDNFAVNTEEAQQAIVDLEECTVSGEKMDGLK